MKSKYLTQLLIWATVQLSIGALGWFVNQMTIQSDSAFSSDQAEALVWQAVFAGMFSWGLILLAAWLAVAAIGDFLGQLGGVEKSTSVQLPKQNEEAGVANVHENNGRMFVNANKDAWLSSKDRKIWEEAGKPDLSSWDGTVSFQHWFSNLRNQ
ncbi:MAG: hypothetical protein RLZZ138_490 [Actinomycetota bacterium]